MTETFDRLATALDRRTEGYGVRVVERPLGPDTPAQFDGPTITLDPGYDPESRCYYLAHALGSIAQWSTAAAQTRRIFDELHAAEAARASDPDRFERAVAGHVAFEERSSGHAVWLLAALGHEWAVAGYTVFFRADLAAIDQFHRTGLAGVLPGVEGEGPAGRGAGRSVRAAAGARIPSRSDPDTRSAS
jgi:hypothetical protein